MTQINKQECCSGLGVVLTPELFKALSDPTRVSLLVRLAECCGEMSVSQVAECCPIDMSVVSRHLATLRDAGAVTSVKRGKEVLYTLRAGSLVKTLRAIADEIEKCCPSKETTDEQTG
jgi:DNA-binding transcriptional ArsR family regulator